MKTSIPTTAPTVLRIKDLPPNIGLGGVRFRYPGDGQLYYWASQWAKGVWGRKNPNSGQIFPLFCDTVEEALEWEVVPESEPQPTEQ